MDLEIKVDGRLVTTNEFVQKIICNVLVGVLDSLRDVENWKEATFTLTKTL